MIEIILAFLAGSLAGFFAPAILGESTPDTLPERPGYRITTKDGVQTYRKIRTGKQPS